VERYQKNLQGLATVKDLELLSYPRLYPTEEYIAERPEWAREECEKLRRNSINGDLIQTKKLKMLELC